MLAPSGESGCGTGHSGGIGRAASVAGKVERGTRERVALEARLHSEHQPHAVLDPGQEPATDEPRSRRIYHSSRSACAWSPARTGSTVESSAS